MTSGLALPELDHRAASRLVVVAVVVAFVGLIAGQLLTDACGTNGECSSVEALAIVHVPVQAIVVGTALRVARRAEPHRHRLVLLAVLAASPIAAAAPHLVLLAQRNRLIDGG